MTVFRMPGEIPLPQPADYELAIATTVEAEQIHSGQDVLPAFHGHVNVNPQYGEYIMPRHSSVLRSSRTIVLLSNLSILAKK